MDGRMDALRRSGRSVGRLSAREEEHRRSATVHTDSNRTDGRLDAKAREVWLLMEERSPSGWRRRKRAGG